MDIFKIFSITEEVANNFPLTMKFHTVEWGRNVARIHSQLKTATHFILPDLPEADIKEKAFFEASNNRKIVTVAAGRHTAATFDERLRQLLVAQNDTSDLEKLLIVGGNQKDGISTLDAISRAKSWCSSQQLKIKPDIWCVANPNDINSVSYLKDKLLAGADGVVTQPLMTSHALDVLDSYPTMTTTVVGVALPKTSKGLLFWLKLLEQPEVEHDEAFQASLIHFESNKSPLEWATSQIESIPQELVDGLHYMPMSNTDLLVDLIGGEE